MTLLLQKNKIVYYFMLHIYLGAKTEFHFSPNLYAKTNCPKRSFWKILYPPAYNNFIHLRHCYFHKDQLNEWQNRIKQIATLACFNYHQMFTLWRGSVMIKQLNIDNIFTNLSIIVNQFLSRHWYFISDKFEVQT